MYIPYLLIVGIIIIILSLVIPAIWPTDSSEVPIAIFLTLILIGGIIFLIGVQRLSMHRQKIRMNPSKN